MKKRSNTKKEAWHLYHKDAELSSQRTPSKDDNWLADQWLTKLKQLTDRKKESEEQDKNG